MILAISRDLIILEMMELVQLKVSMILEIPAKAVTIKLGERRGKLVPTVNVDPKFVEGIDESQVREVIGGVFFAAMAEMNERLIHLDTRRPAARGRG